MLKLSWWWLLLMAFHDLIRYFFRSVVPTKSNTKHEELYRVLMNSNPLLCMCLEKMLVQLSFSFLFITFLSRHFTRIVPTFNAFASLVLDFLFPLDANELWNINHFPFLRKTWDQFREKQFVYSSYAGKSLSDFAICKYCYSQRDHIR